MGHKKLDISLTALTLIFSFISWFSVNRAINVENSSIWAVPIFCFSLYFITLCLSFVLIRKKFAVEIMVLVSFLLSFIFSWDISRIFAFIFASLGMAIALYKIKKDMLLNIKVDLGKSIGTAKFIIVLSIALMISSQYYGEVKNRDGQKIIPKLDLSSITNVVTPNLISIINPQFKSLDNNGLTVDEFVLQIQNDQIKNNPLAENNDQKINEMIEKQGGSNLTSEQKDAIKKDTLEQLAQSENELAKTSQALVLEEGRKKLSEMSGHQLSGSEKITEVFSDIVNKKINEYLMPGIDQGSMPILPIIIAIILFLTIAYLGNLVSILLVQIVKFIFKLFIRYGWITIKKIQTEVESIE
jgi:hypothetical protein